MQKGLHDLEHASDSHCTDQASAHYHGLSHTCSLCDYAPGKILKLTTYSDFVFIDFSSVFLFLETDAIQVETVKYFFLLRAPPVIF